MSDTPHINKWFEGFFKPAPEFNEDSITRWISQKCIGYQSYVVRHEIGKQFRTVYEAQIEMHDGTIKDIWFLTVGNTIHKEIVLEQPRIDIPQKEREE